jgi:NADH-quinone oxidoreductase subunit J
MIETVLFYAFGGLTVLGAVLAVARASAVHCAIWLIVSLLGTAGLFLLNGAEFLFVSQIIVYVGGIMVLFLFVIMLVNLEAAARERQFRRRWPAALALALVLGAGVVRALAGGVRVANPQELEVEGGNTERLAETLFGPYLLPFELVSVLLLAAIVGAVIMAQPGKKQA